MKLKIVYFVWFSGLLFAILAAIVVQGNRILRALPYAPDVQDVRITNTEPLQVQIQPSDADQETPAAILERQRIEAALKHWPSASSSSH